MQEGDRAALEDSVRSACQRGDLTLGLTQAIKGYGPELFGFLLAVKPSEADASDTFGELMEALWRGLPTFEWRSSFRTWAYSIARNIMRAERRDAGRLRRRAQPVGESAIAELAHHVRTETLTYLRTGKRTQIQLLRDALPEDDRILLVLRVDRNLAWNELASILTEGEGDVPLAASEVAREAAKLRKRFQALKDRLREMARERGILD